MPVPTFTLEPSTSGARPMNPTLAAMRIGVARRAIDKLTASGVLETPVTEPAVDSLARRPLLQVASGELTVLRTDSRKPAGREDDRDVIGFGITDDDDLLTDTSLRWWRSEPERVVDNRLFAVTVGTIPVAVYEILLHRGTQSSGERQLRHRYGGTLLARLVPRGSAQGAQRLLESDPGDAFEAITPVSEGEHPLLTGPGSTPASSAVGQIMRSRIVVDSGGPVGYLAPSRAASDQASGALAASEGRR